MYVRFRRLSFASQTFEIRIYSLISIRIIAQSKTFEVQRYVLKRKRKPSKFIVMILDVIVYFWNSTACILTYFVLGLSFSNYFEFNHFIVFRYNYRKFDNILNLLLIFIIKFFYFFTDLLLFSIYLIRPTPIPKHDAGSYFL